VHVFSFGEEEFRVPDPELGFSDERKVTLGELVGGVGDRFRYTYDFGDDWQHDVIIEDVLEADPRHSLPGHGGGEGAYPQGRAGSGGRRASERSSPTPGTWLGLTTPASMTRLPSPPRTSTTNSLSAALAAEPPSRLFPKSPGQRLADPRHLTHFVHGDRRRHLTQFRETLGRLIRRDNRLLPELPYICRTFRGDDRNRTGVDGFAGRCVATPPRRPRTLKGTAAPDRFAACPGGIQDGALKPLLAASRARTC
jgi:hypothetical protein